MLVWLTLPMKSAFSQLILSPGVLLHHEVITQKDDDLKKDRDNRNTNYAPSPISKSHPAQLHRHRDDR